MNKLNTVILALIVFSVFLLLDHLRIHGYLFDKHDLGFRSEALFGFGSHEAFFIISLVAITGLLIFKILS